MPSAFLSSAYLEKLPGAAPRYFSLRRSIHGIGEAEGVPVWVAEISDPGLQPDDDDWVKPIKGCIEELWKSDLLIVILASRSGNPYELGRSLGATVASVFEVELFHASNWGVPTVFFVANGYKPERELLNLIDILHLRDNRNWWQLDEDDIESEVRSLLRQLRSQSGSAEWQLRFIPDRLAQLRSCRRADDEVSSTNLSFIGRFAPTDRADFSLKRFEELLGQSDLEQAENRYHQLSFLWMALRELSIGNAHESERRSLWQKLAGEWSTASAWLGLHGYLNTGVLSAFHTQTDLRRRGVRQRIPYGGFASELYSVARLVQTPVWKRRLFRLSAELATRQMRDRPEDESGGLAIRASAKAQLALLRRPWLALSALSDYQRSYDLRRKLGHSDDSVGEALVELGYAQFQLAARVHWRWQAALDRMREGIVAMQKDSSANRAGFVVRAKRKYAECLYRAGRRDKAAKELRDAHALAATNGLASQIRQIQQIEARWVEPPRP